MSDEGCLLMLSNSDCSAKNPEDRFFEDLYSNFFIERVWAKRGINANASKRGKLTELLILSNIPEKCWVKLWPTPLPSPAQKPSS